MTARKLLNLVTGQFYPDHEGARLRLLMVVNTTRPLTSSVPLIVAYIQEFGAVDGLINNTHLGAETTVELIQEGAVLVTEAARRVGLPVVATAALRPYARRSGRMTGWVIRYGLWTAIWRSLLVKRRVP